MKKILFVLPSLTQTNGVSAFLINYLSIIDLSKFKISILSSDLRPSQKHLEFFYERNIKVYFLEDLRQKGFSRYIKSLKKFFKENHDFDVIYSNVANQSLFIFNEAKRYGIRNFALHSHATISSDNALKMIINDIFINIITKQTKCKIACSYLAGKAMFKSNDFIVVNNAIDYKKFAYSEIYKKEIRENLKIKDNEIVIGFVGRFAPQKNVFFFEKLAQKISDRYKILMIGTGPQKQEFINLINKDNIANKFVLIDECSDVYKYYSAMDIFLLPSLYEGLHVVAIEAQANGLLCLISDTISKECKILQNTIFLSRLKIDDWIKKINEDNFCRSNDKKLNDKFNINIQAKMFEEILINM